jgi:hypothetical protein
MSLDSVIPQIRVVCPHAYVNGTAQTPENLEFQRRGAEHSNSVMVDGPGEDSQHALSDGSSLEK